MPDLSGVLQSLPGFMQIINVVVLLSALFFFTSTVASHLVEVIVGFLNSRGKQLRARLETALGKDAADAFYNDPLIQSLSSVSEPGKISKLWDYLAGAVRTSWSASTGAAGDKDQGKALQLHPPSYIEPEYFAKVVATLDASTSQVIQDIKTKLGGAGEQLEPKLVEWFKAINDRQNGVYTRWTFLRLLAIGFALALVVDIDTVHIAGTLWQNPDKAEKAVKLLDGLEKTSLQEAEKKQIRESVAQAFQEMRNIAPPNYAWQNPPKLPWVWKWEWWPFGKNDKWQAEDLKPWLAKLLGWLLTAVATSLGAQFWFNLMSEALKLRAAGRKPDEDAKKDDRKKKDQDTAGAAGGGGQTK